MKIEERYFVATENNNFELEAIYWAETMLEATDEAERRKRMFPDETVVIAKKMKIYDKPLASKGGN